jgi:small subunit ribosomal protein S3
MDERKFVQFKKDESAVKEYVKNSLGKGRVSSIKVEYTPVGEKIIVATNKPGLVIGRRGEKINELTAVLKKRFKLENPHIEIREITKPEFDSQIIADEIAISLERLGSLKFKTIAYKMLQRIMDAGALGVELRLSGKLPSERAKSWRFASGYLKKTGDTAKIVDKAQAVGKTIAGIVGVKVAILSPDKEIHDQININEKILGKIKENILAEQIIMAESDKKKKTKKKIKEGKESK